MSAAASESDRRKYYGALYPGWGAQHRWPAGSQFEVVGGAYRTQNTVWTDVERGLQNLRSAHRLTVDGIRNVRAARLERRIGLADISVKKRSG